MLVHRESTPWGKSAILALANGGAIVMIGIFDDVPEIAMIHDLVVHRTMRGIGLGNALLGAAEEEAKKMGAEVARVSVEPKTWQVAWYKRHGYTEQGKAYVDKHQYLTLEKQIRREAEEPQ